MSEFRCPKCGGEQLCPCEHCNNKGVTWIFDGDLIACGYCGYKVHVDTWLDHEAEHYARRI